MHLTEHLNRLLGAITWRAVLDTATVGVSVCGLELAS